MKNYLTILSLAALVSVSASAQTNTAITPSLVVTNAPVESGKQAGQWELTLGGGGTSFRNENMFGLDLSISTNPLKARPEIWIGLSQSFYWEPSFAGSTDIGIDWSQNLWKDTLYLNVGWSGGALYDNTGASPVWRSGPEATFQYYTSDNAFIYAGVNYDVFQSGNTEGGFRYSFGIGLSF